MNSAGLITVVKHGTAIATGTLAARMVAARERKNWTQQQAADAAGVAQTTIANLEAGIRKRPRDLLAIAAALGVSALWLETGRGAMVPDNPHLRPEITDLALLMERTLTADQVATLREMVVAFGMGPTAHPSNIRRKLPKSKG